MQFEIGQRVVWITSEYWSTKHPDECGYNDVSNEGFVMNFDSKNVVVWSYRYKRPEVLLIWTTSWKILGNTLIESE